MRFSNHLKERLTEFLKRLVGQHSEKSILQIEREVRNRGREKAAARAFGGDRLPLPRDPSHSRYWRAGPPPA